MEDQAGTRTLMRSATDRKLGGVAGGLGHYLGVDANAVRLVWILAVPFTGGLALLAYVALWFLLPEGETGWAEPAAWASGGGVRTAGIVLVVLGALFLLGQVTPFVFHLGHFVWPLALVALGILLIVRHERRLI